ncbi:unnamed protein product [Caenorhabditis brenneri]
MTVQEHLSKHLKRTAPYAEDLIRSVDNKPSARVIGGRYLTFFSPALTDSMGSRIERDKSRRKDRVQVPIGCQAYTCSPTGQRRPITNIRKQRLGIQKASGGRSHKHPKTTTGESKSQTTSQNRRISSKLIGRSTKSTFRFDCFMEFARLELNVTSWSRELLSSKPTRRILRSDNRRRRPSSAKPTKTYQEVT